VKSNSWDGKLCAGPIPILFSSDPKSALARLKAFPELAHAAMQLLSGSLVTFETLSSPAEAARYIREPWTSKAASPLARDWVDPTSLHHKKARLQQESSNSSGDNSGLLMLAYQLPI